MHVNLLAENRELIRTLGKRFTHLLALVLLFFSPHASARTVTASEPVTLKTIESVRATLADQRGTILLVFMSRSGPILCNPILKFLALAPEVHLVLNETNLGRFCDDELIKFMPRTGLNRLKVFHKTGVLMGQYQFAGLRSLGVTTKTLALTNWEDPARGQLIDVGRFLDANLDVALSLGWVTKINQFFDILRGNPVKIQKSYKMRNWNTAQKRVEINESDSYEIEIKTGPQSTHTAEAQIVNQDKGVYVEPEKTTEVEIDTSEAETRADRQTKIAADRRSMY